MQRSLQYWLQLAVWAAVLGRRPRPAPAPESVRACVQELRHGQLFPRFSAIQSVSRCLVAAVAEHMCGSGAGSVPADFEAVAARAGIRSIPTMLLFRDGKEVARTSGAMDVLGVLRWFKEHS